MYQSRIRLSASLVTTLLVTLTAKADVIFEIESASYVVGGSGSVIVSVTGAANKIASADLNLLVAPVGSVGSSIRFLPRSSTHTLEGSEYLFSSGFSQNQAIEPSTVSSSSLPQDTASWTDATLSGANVTESGRRIAAEFNFQHLFPAGTDPSQLINDEFEFFLTGSYADANFAISSITPASSRISAVPEPNSIGLLALITVGSITLRHRGPFIRNQTQLI